MAKVEIARDVMYAGKVYAAGEHDIPDFMVEDLEAKGLLVGQETEIDPNSTTDPSSLDPDQPPARPPAGEPGGEDLKEAPRRHFETRPVLPGSEVGDLLEGDEKFPRASATNLAGSRQAAPEIEQSESSNDRPPARRATTRRASEKQSEADGENPGEDSN